MKTVWKYTLDPYRPTVFAPVGAKWLCAHEQWHDICLWAEVDPQRDKAVYSFEVHGTGETIPATNDRKYLGTCFLDGGSLVLHVFVIN